MDLVDTDDEEHYSTNSRLVPEMPYIPIMHRTWNETGRVNNTFCHFGPDSDDSDSDSYDGKASYHDSDYSSRSDSTLPGFTKVPGSNNRYQWTGILPTAVEPAMQTPMKDPHATDAEPPLIYSTPVALPSPVRSC
jgi:hypothetical protein